MYTYKCIPVSKNVTTTKKGSTNDTASMIQNVINEMAVDGWEYRDTISTTTLIPPGCIASLLGGRGTSIASNILVFRKGDNA